MIKYPLLPHRKDHFERWIPFRTQREYLEIRNRYSDEIKKMIIQLPDNWTNYWYLNTLLWIDNWSYDWDDFSSQTDNVINLLDDLRNRKIKTLLWKAKFEIMKKTWWWLETDYEYGNQIRNLIGPNKYEWLLYSRKQSNLPDFNNEIHYSSQLVPSQKYTELMKKLWKSWFLLTLIEYVSIKEISNARKIAIEIYFLLRSKFNTTKYNMNKQLKQMINECEETFSKLSNNEEMYYMIHNLEFSDEMNEVIDILKDIYIEIWNLNHLTRQEIARDQKIIEKIIWTQENHQLDEYQDIKVSYTEINRATKKMKLQNKQIRKKVKERSQKNLNTWILDRFKWLFWKR